MTITEAAQKFGDLLAGDENVLKVYTFDGRLLIVVVKARDNALPTKKHGFDVRQAVVGGF